MNEMERIAECWDYGMDPRRAVLPEDSDAWLTLLAMCLDDDLRFALFTVRVHGARLERNERFGFCIVPCGNKEVWDKMRNNYFISHIKEITAMLKATGEDMNG